MCARHSNSQSIYTTNNNDDDYDDNEDGGNSKHSVDGFSHIIDLLFPSH